jgi:hypothetical protein
MEHTRSQIRGTVEELKDRVNERLDWRHYVDQYPGTSLTVAVGLGLLLGRSLGGLIRRRNGMDESDEYEYGGPRLAERYGDAGLTAAAPVASAPALSGARRAVGQSVSRLGSRAEGILNRLIDELTDAVESTLVPALTTRFRSLLDFERRGRRRHEGGYGEGRRWDEPVREERSGVYPGGPAGPQHFPSQGRTADQT